MVTPAYIPPRARSEEAGRPIVQYRRPRPGEPVERGRLSSEVVRGQSPFYSCYSESTARNRSHEANKVLPKVS